MDRKSLFALVCSCALAALALGVGALSAAPVRAEPSPLQASCGDGRCQPPEDCNTCDADCGDCCGNGRCEPPEDCNTCSRDCGECCGNRRCEPPEDEDSCPSDCA